MSFLLRAIRKPRWYQLEWLDEGKAQANALLDLQPQENKLSFWHVEDDESNLGQVVVAIAAGRDAAANFDYVLFNQTHLMKTNVRIEHTEGGSFHKEANQDWHRDIVKLSAEKVAELANIIMEHGTKDRISENEVISSLKYAVTSGIIDKDKLKPNLKERII